MIFIIDLSFGLLNIRKPYRMPITISLSKKWCVVLSQKTKQYCIYYNVITKKGFKFSKIIVKYSFNWLNWSSNCCRSSQIHPLRIMDVCAEFHSKTSNKCWDISLDQNGWPTDWPTLPSLGCLHSWKVKHINATNRDINGFTKFHGNPSKNYCDVSLKTTNVNLMVALVEKWRDMNPFRSSEITGVNRV